MVKVNSSSRVPSAGENSAVVSDGSLLGGTTSGPENQLGLSEAAGYRRVSMPSENSK